MSHPATGWVCDPAQVEQTCEALAKSGHTVLFGDAKPALKGFARSQMARGVYGSFLWDAEKALFGKFLPAWHQFRGTCVGQGTARSLQDSWWGELSLTGEVGKPTEFSVEFIYGIGRVEIGGGRIGGDGCVGAWAAKGVHDYGVLPRGVYGKFDLTKPKEDLSVHWGTRGVGVPKPLKDAASAFKVRCHRLMTAEEIADAVYAKKGVAWCTGMLWSNSRGADGLARRTGSTAHCEAIRGAYLTESDHLALCPYRSWSEGYQRGPTTIQIKGGQVEWPNGAYGVLASDVERGLRSGNDEAWVFDFDVGPRTTEGTK